LGIIDIRNALPVCNTPEQVLVLQLSPVITSVILRNPLNLKSDLQVTHSKNFRIIFLASIIILSVNFNSTAKHATMIGIAGLILSLNQDINCP
jgi:hypothetical protein